jgi:hypothetical protein
LSVSFDARSARQRVARLRASPSRAFNSAKIASGAARTWARMRPAWAAHPGDRRGVAIGAGSSSPLASA